MVGGVAVAIVDALPRSDARVPHSAASRPQEPERWSSLSVVANTRKAARCRGTGGPAKYMS